MDFILHRGLELRATGAFRLRVSPAASSPAHEVKIGVIIAGH